MFHFFKKDKKEKLRKAVEAQKIRRESDIIHKVENFRFTPCGFDYSDMIKRRNRRA
jgi:hypothetical protein